MVCTKFFYTYSIKWHGLEFFKNSLSNIPYHFESICRCNKVTLKKNELIEKQSALHVFIDVSFSGVSWILNVPALLFGQQNAARSQQKKGKLRWGLAYAESNSTRNWAYSELFSQPPTAPAWAAETSVSVSVKDFHDQLKIYDQCCSNSRRNKEWFI